MRVDVATSGRPGPVVIALSEEMQKDRVAVPDLLARARVTRGVPRSRSCFGARCESMLAKAKKPIAVVGGSCWSSGGAGGAAQVSGRDQYPGDGGFPPPGTLRWHHRINFAGDLGVGSDPNLIGKLKEADLILAIGSRLGDAVTQGYHAAGHGGWRTDHPGVAGRGGDWPGIQDGAGDCR